MGFSLPEQANADSENWIQVGLPPVAAPSPRQQEDAAEAAGQTEGLEMENARLRAELAVRIAAESSQVLATRRRSQPSGDPSFTTRNPGSQSPWPLTRARFQHVSHACRMSEEL